MPPLKIRRIVSLRSRVLGCARLRPRLVVRTRRRTAVGDANRPLRPVIIRMGRLIVRHI